MTTCRPAAAVASSALRDGFVQGELCPGSTHTPAPASETQRPGAEVQRADTAVTLVVAGGRPPGTPPAEIAVWVGT